MVSTPGHRRVAQDCLSAQGGWTSVQGTALAKGLQDIGPSSGTTPMIRHPSGGSWRVFATRERHHDGTPDGQPGEMPKGACPHPRLCPAVTGWSQRETTDSHPRWCPEPCPEEGGPCLHTRPFPSRELQPSHLRESPLWGQQAGEPPQATLRPLMGGSGCFPSHPHSSWNASCTQLPWGAQ